MHVLAVVYFSGFRCFLSKYCATKFTWRRYVPLYQMHIWYKHVFFWYPWLRLSCHVVTIPISPPKRCPAGWHLKSRCTVWRLTYWIFSSWEKQSQIHALALQYFQNRHCFVGSLGLYIFRVSGVFFQGSVQSNAHGVGLSLSNRCVSEKKKVYSFDILGYVYHVTLSLAIPLSPPKGKLLVSITYFRSLVEHLSHLISLWYVSSSVSSFTKEACAAIQWG